MLRWDRAQPATPDAHTLHELLLSLSNRRPPGGTKFSRLDFNALSAPYTDTAPLSRSPGSLDTLSAPPVQRRPRAASWLGAGSARPRGGPPVKNGAADINVGCLRQILRNTLKSLRNAADKTSTSHIDIGTWPEKGGRPGGPKCGFRKLWPIVSGNFAWAASSSYWRRSSGLLRARDGRWLRRSLAAVQWRARASVAGDGNRRRANPSAHQRPGTAVPGRVATLDVRGPPRRTRFAPSTPPRRARSSPTASGA